MNTMENKQEEFKKKTSEQKRKYRAKLTEEQKQLIRKRDKEKHELYRSNVAEERKQRIREQDKRSHQLYRSKLSEEKKLATRQRNQESHQLYRSKLSEEKKLATRQQNQESHLKEMQKNPTIDNFDIYSTNFLQDIDLVECVKECTEDLNYIKILPDEEDYENCNEMYKMAICVVCDHHITYNIDLYWISTEILKAKEDILNGAYAYNNELNPLLKAQYSVNNPILSHLLLSPRARRKKENTSDLYSCCRVCYDHLTNVKNQSNNPPKYAIANGFAIGYIPQALVSTITPVVNNLLAPVRAFNFFISFTGGKEQKITGNFTFFTQNIPQNIGALEQTSLLNRNPHVFVLLIGPFTPQQKYIIKNQQRLTVDSFKQVYEFLQKNNPHYKDFPTVDNIPLPTIHEILDKDHTILTGDTNDQEIEREICWYYWFPNVGDPDSIQGTYTNQKEFAKALFLGESPTLIYHPSKIMSGKLKLSTICPLAFPFGTGDIDSKRRPKVSELECLQHYLKLSLPQFQEGQCILIIHHIFQRQKSFLTGIAKCNITKHQHVLGEEFATISTDDLHETINSMVNNRQSIDEISKKPKVAQLLKSIKTSCAPLGFTNEAAAEARGKMFALWTTFGPPSIFITFSPCDECSFRMQLFAIPEVQQLPSIHTAKEILAMNFNLRKNLRVQFPGACAKTFDSLLHILISDLFGWKSNGQRYKSIIGKILAWTYGVEEQAKTTLHAHIIIWIFEFYILHQQLFSENQHVREKAIQTLKEYLQMIWSSSFDITLNKGIVHNLHHLHPIDKNNTTSCDGNIDGVSLQTLREMRHIEYSKKHHGLIITCNKCMQEWNSMDVVNAAIQHLFSLSKHEYPQYWPEDLQLPLSQDQIEVLALRFSYDMKHIPDHCKSLKTILKLIAIIFFNTHEWKHRNNCFKKNNECRFHLPQKPYPDFYFSYKGDPNKLFYNETLNTTVKWYYISGQWKPMCNFEVKMYRQPWDVFVNDNNPIITNIFGYNNNICMGSINTLFYCTLYSSKSNQAEETCPFKKACQAVAKQIQRVTESHEEKDITPRQIGLRRLLSGINAHISSCVISATMAWYLVVHNSRFQFSHDFKPLLLSQLEAWYYDKPISFRIRHLRRNKRISTMELTTPSSNESLADQNFWLDCDVNNYLFRPNLPLFHNMCVWEYQSHFDTTISLHEILEDDGKQLFRFQRTHPGYFYSCLKLRQSECVPILYYDQKFPDIESLQLDKANETVLEPQVYNARESYALKALLLFYPFQSKECFKHKSNSLWSLYQEKLHEGKLYKYVYQVLQHIQDLYNVRKIPVNIDPLEECTQILDDFAINSKSNEVDEDVFDQNVLQDDLDLIRNYEDPMEILNDSNYKDTEENSCFIPGNHFLLQKDPVLSMNSILTMTSKEFQILNTSEPISSPHLEPTQEKQATAKTNNTSTNALITVISKALNINGHNNYEISTINNEEQLPTLNDQSINIQSLNVFAKIHSLDTKQQLAFKTICSSFIISYLNDPTCEISTLDKENLCNQLKKQGAEEQLIMFVTGPAGSGKSHVIQCCQIYCKQFCDAIRKPFDFSVFPITATTNTAASQLGGKTIHIAAMLNNRRISIDLSTEVDWTMTKLLIIDEISMAPKSMLSDLDRHLRILTGNRDMLYGGLHIVFAGDFSQLTPFDGTAIFNDTEDIHWHGCLSTCVFLDKENHRFINDPDWGLLVERIQMGISTQKDIDILNTRVINDDLTLPSNIDCTKTRVAYACYTNKQRNKVTDECFYNFVSQNNPVFDSTQIPPYNALLVKGLLTNHGATIDVTSHNTIWATCGDDNLIGSTREKIRVDPCLKLFYGSPVMVNNNSNKQSKIYKGTLANFIGVQWKQNCAPHIENYFGYKVWSTTVNQIESLILLRESSGKQEANKQNNIVQIKPQTFSITIKMPETNKKIKGLKITQFPIILALAITGHKLQGMTKDIVIVTEIASAVLHWLYVVLSRVTTMQGLFLLQPLELNMFKPMHHKLKQELNWLRQLEAKLINRVN